MGKHDYSQNTVSGIASEISKNKSVVENAVLSTEAMQYSWEAGIVHNVVTWLEVKQFNLIKAELDFILTRADSKLENISGIIENTDYTASVSLNNQVNTLNSLSGKTDALLNTLAGYGAVKEVHGWKPEEEAVIYDISAYVYYDSEKKSYYIKDKEKIKNLQLKKDISEDEINTLSKIYKLAVREDGSINTELLEDLMECAYSEKREIKEDKHLTKKIGWSSVGSVTPYTYEKYYQGYDYYTVYTKSDNLKKIAETLSGDKYTDLRTIIINSHKKIEGVHKHGEVFITDQMISPLVTQSYNEYKKDKLKYVINEEGTDGFSLNIKIDKSAVLDSNRNSSVNKYTVSYSTKNKENKKSDYLVYKVYQHIDDCNFAVDIYKDISNDRDNDERKSLSEALEYFAKDEKIDYSGVIQEVGFVAAGRVAGAVSKFVPGVDWVVDIVSVTLAYEDALEEQRQNQADNNKIKEIRDSLDAYQKNELIVKETLAALYLKGYHCNYIVRKNSKGIITKVEVQNVTAVNQYDFSGEYVQFCKYQSSHKNEMPPLTDKNGDGILSFDDLDESTQTKMISWKTFQFL